MPRAFISLRLLTNAIISYQRSDSRFAFDACHRTANAIATTRSSSSLIRFSTAYTRTCLSGITISRADLRLTALPASVPYQHTRLYHRSRPCRIRDAHTGEAASSLMNAGFPERYRPEYAMASGCISKAIASTLRRRFGFHLALL